MSEFYFPIRSKGFFHEDEADLINHIQDSLYKTDIYQSKITDDILSIDGMYKAMGFEKRNNTYPQLTDHYFTGDYPVKPIDNLEDDKVTQLSLLSTSSNN